jgi:hypothetical protein
MARYLETAKQLRGAIERLATRLNLTNEDVAEIGLIANLAVRFALAGRYSVCRLGEPFASLLCPLT